MAAIDAGLKYRGLPEVETVARQLARSSSGSRPEARSPHRMAFADLAPAIVAAGTVGAERMAAFLALA